MSYGDDKDIVERLRLPRWIDGRTPTGKALHDTLYAGASEIETLRERIRQMQEWAQAFRETIEDPTERVEFEATFFGEPQPLT